MDVKLGKMIILKIERKVCYGKWIKWVYFMFLCSNPNNLHVGIIFSMSPAFILFCTLKSIMLS